MACIEPLSRINQSLQNNCIKDHNQTQRSCACCPKNTIRRGTFGHTHSLVNHLQVISLHNLSEAIVNYGSSDLILNTENCLLGTLTTCIRTDTLQAVLNLAVHAPLFIIAPECIRKCTLICFNSLCFWWLLSLRYNRVIFSVEEVVVVDF